MGERHVSPRSSLNRASVCLSSVIVALVMAATPLTAATQKVVPGPKPAAPAAVDPKTAMDTLFSRLAEAKSPQEAQDISTSIERLWLRSGSDTADLLMGRALTALTAKDNQLALQVLDKVIDLEPDWAEVWNKRATIRYLENDDAGSMSDISHVLALEPRHFGALAGMGFILQRNGNGKAALQVFRRLLDVNPQQEGITKIVERLIPEVEGLPL